MTSEEIDKIAVKIPSLGESISEARIAKWYKKQGDQVLADELLAELETEKVTLELNAPATGLLSEVKQQAGEVVLVGEIIAYVLKSSVEKMVNANDKINSLKPAESITSDNTKEQDLVKPDAESVNNNSQEACSINNIHKLRQDESNLNMSDKENKSPAPCHKKSPLDYNRVPMSPIRKAIARRLKEAQNNAAILTSFNEINMSQIISLRQKHRKDFEEKYKCKLGFMPFFVKAVIAALKEYPIINASIDGQDIIYKNYYNIGIAVGSDAGLIVPVVRDADLLEFSEIELQIENFAQKARSGNLLPDDLSGGSFTITNGGIYGSLFSTPIINPPQSAILGLHKIEDRPVVIDNQIQIRPMMYAALSYDHRIIDGREAVSFLQKIKILIEEPELFCLNL